MGLRNSAWNSYQSQKISHQNQMSPSFFSKKRKGKSKKRWITLRDLFGILICAKDRNLSTFPNSGHATRVNMLKFDNDLTSDIITEKKALYSGRTHFEKVGFFHELPICIILYITEFLEIELSNSIVHINAASKSLQYPRQIEYTNLYSTPKSSSPNTRRSPNSGGSNNSHTQVIHESGSHRGHSEGVSSHVIRQVVGIFRPWSTIRFIFPNISLDITVYNSSQDLKFLAQHAKRLRLKGGILKSSTIRGLLLRSYLESLSLKLSVKGVRRLLEQHHIQDDKAKLYGYISGMHEECDDYSDSSSATSSLLTRRFDDSKRKLRELDISGSTVFRIEESQDGLSLFAYFLYSFPHSFPYLSSFIAENCDGLSGIHIRELIAIFSERRYPLEHFIVSPTKDSKRSIHISDYAGIEMWPLKSLKIVVHNSNERSSRFTTFADIINPLQNTLITFSCNLPFPEVRQLFDSTRFVKLRALHLPNLGHVDLDEEFLKYLQNNTLRTLSIGMENQECIQHFESIQSLVTFNNISSK